MPRIVSRKTTSLADVRSQVGKYVEGGVRTHEGVTITKNGKPAAVLISTEDLEALEETSFWAGQERVDEEGPTVGLAVVMADVHSRQDQD